MQHIVRVTLSLAVLAWAVSGQEPNALKYIRKVYIEKMPNDLDQYLRKIFD